MNKSRLGRIPSPPDERDYRLADFLVPAAAPSATTVFIQSLIALLKALIAWLEGPEPTPSPQPNPQPEPTAVVWSDDEPVLDQGDYGTCVGNGWADWGNTNPVDDHYTEKDARAIYYEATVFDGSPDDPDAPGGGQQGATVRSGAKAMLKRERLSAYAFASSLVQIIQYVSTQGPLVVGTYWTSDMFEPDQTGLVTPTGDVEGGHCYLLLGYDPQSDEFLFLNSWGDGWGLGGYFWMRASDFEILFANGGEAVAAVELA